MNWQQVLERDDIVGGEIETIEDGVVYRGPVSAVRVESDIIYFDSPWCAKLVNGRWIKNDITTSFISAEYCPPSDIGGGRVHFTVPMLGPGTIFPKGSSKLDPANVEGLELEA